MKNPEETLIKHILSVLDNWDDTSNEKKDIVLEVEQLLVDIRKEKLTNKLT